MRTLGRILTPVDFSPPSRAALEYAAFLGDSYQAFIDVLFESGIDENAPSHLQSVQESNRHKEKIAGFRKRWSLEILG